MSVENSGLIWLAFNALCVNVRNVKVGGEACEFTFKRSGKAEQFLLVKDIKA